MVRRKTKVRKMMDKRNLPKVARNHEPIPHPVYVGSSPCPMYKKIVRALYAMQRVLHLTEWERVMRLTYIPFFRNIKDWRPALRVKIRARFGQRMEMPWFRTRRRLTHCTYTT